MRDGVADPASGGAKRISAHNATKMEIRDGKRPTMAVYGPLDYHCAAEFDAAIGSLLSESDVAELDLRSAEYIDSRCLSVLANGYLAAARSGKTLCLSACSPQIERVLKLSGLGESLGLFTTADAPASSAKLPGRRQKDWQIYESVAKSDSDLIRELRKIAVQAAVECGMDAKLVADIEIAVGEALTNAYRHGSPRKPRNKIRLKCMTSADIFVAEIMDEGPPFVPSINPQPEPRGQKSGGLGMFLISTIMDKVDISNDGCGNRVRLVKRLANRQKNNPPDL